MVGNITERDSARDLALAGADGLRVGQGPSAICTTRPEIGIGCPQVTAIHETVEGVEDAAKKDSKYRIPVCADGGINNRGDISVAIAARASSVMIERNWQGQMSLQVKLLNATTVSRLKSIVVWVHWVRLGIVQLPGRVTER